MRPCSTIRNWLLLLLALLAAPSGAQAQIFGAGVLCAEAGVISGRATVLDFTGSATASVSGGVCTINVTGGGGGGSGTVTHTTGALTASRLVVGNGADDIKVLASLGTTTTVLHGNAAGLPTFGAVVSADLNITPTSCTDQAVTAISAGGVGTCTTITNAMLANSSITVTGTANRITVTGSPVALGGAVTLNAPQDIHTAATPIFASLTLSANTNQLTLGTTTTTTITMASLGANRTFTLPDANSNPVRPLTCSSGDFVAGVASTGIISCGTPPQGTVTTTGSPSNGNLTKFTGATSISNADLSGDVTTAGGVATTIANDAVTTAKILNAAVTKAKIENVAADKLLGRGNGGGAGAPQEITLGTNLSMSGTTLNAAGGSASPGGSTGDLQINDGAGGFDGFAGASCPPGEFATDIGTDGALTCDTAAGGGTVTNTGGALTANRLVLGAGGADITVLGSLGTTSTVLHGNAAGAPSFGAVVSADLNITTTSCTNQVVTAISAGGVGTCSTVAGAMLAATAVTFAKMQDIATDRLIGRDTAGSGSPEEISVGGGLEFTGSAGIQRSALTGDVTATAGSNSTTIANNAVTTAKIADANVTKAKIENVAADKLLGRGNGGGAGAPQEITLGTNLSLSGTTLNAASGTAVDVQTFSADGTWTKPSGATIVYIFGCGGGGGGGGGQGAAAGSARTGGGGGGGGYCSSFVMRAASLGSTEAVTIGTAGTSGAGGTGAGGADAGGGGTTTFGAWGTWPGGGGGAGNTAGSAGGTGAGCLGAGVSVTSASGGAGGSCFSAGPTAGTTSVDGAVGASSANVASGGVAGNGSSFGAGSGAGSASAGASATGAGGSSRFSGGGGGAGGGVNAASPGTAQNGTAGGDSGMNVAATSGGGGTAGASASACGSGGEGQVGANAGSTRGGQGGGGGASKNAATGCNGGAGGIGGGGGGGGGGGTNVGGAGGAGGVGWVIAISW